MLRDASDLKGGWWLGGKGNNDARGIEEEGQRRLEKVCVKVSAVYQSLLDTKNQFSFWVREDALLQRVVVLRDCRGVVKKSSTEMAEDPFIDIVRNPCPMAPVHLKVKISFHCSSGSSPRVFTFISKPLSLAACAGIIWNSEIWMPVE
jgi:hypothetical protein